MTLAPKFLLALLPLCSLLAPLVGCEAEPSDDDLELRADELDLDSLEPGQCLALGDTLESVHAEIWTEWPGLPAGIIIDDHLLLTSIFEDNVMLRVDGPASQDDTTLVVGHATAIWDDPALEGGCGFCDGLCVDGKCIMDLPPFSIGRDGLCRE
jgi:hypothetical protein